jgi:hypothetical protein
MQAFLISSGKERRKLYECLRDNKRVRFGDTRVDATKHLLGGNILSCIDHGLWTAKVKSVTPDGSALVYDLYEPEHTSMIANGLVVADCNFGFQYSMSARRFALMEGYSIEEAQTFRKGYFTKWGEIAEHHARTDSRVYSDLWVQTIAGRKHFLGWYPLRGGERMRKALNTPVQGTVGDAVNKSLVDLWNWRKMTGIQFKFVAQVHDEIDLIVPKVYTGIVTDTVKSVMKGSVSLGDIPVEVEATVAPRWYVPKEKKPEPIRRFDFSEV